MSVLRVFITNKKDNRCLRIRMIPKFEEKLKLILIITASPKANKVCVNSILTDLNLKHELFHIKFIKKY